MFRIFITILALTLCVGAGAAEDEGEQSITVQAVSFSDPLISVETGEECAVFLNYLRRDLQYTIHSATGVQGPPGVVYMLEDPRREIAIVKCGRGGGCPDHETP